MNMRFRDSFNGIRISKIGGTRGHEIINMPVIKACTINGKRKWYLLQIMISIENYQKFEHYMRNLQA